MLSCLRWKSSFPYWGGFSSWPEVEVSKMRFQCNYKEYARILGPLSETCNVAHLRWKNITLRMMTLVCLMRCNLSHLSCKQRDWAKDIDQDDLHDLRSQNLLSETCNVWPEISEILAPGWWMWVCLVEGKWGHFNVIIKRFSCKWQKDIDQTDLHNSRSQKIKLIKIAMKRQKRKISNTSKLGWGWWQIACGRIWRSYVVVGEGSKKVSKKEGLSWLIPVSGGDSHKTKTSFIDSLIWVHTWAHDVLVIKVLVSIVQKTGACSSHYEHMCYKVFNIWPIKCPPSQWLVHGGLVPLIEWRVSLS